MSDTTNHPHYPDVTVPLSGEDGNGFFIIGRTMKALRRAGIGGEEIARFKNEASSGDYDHLIQTVMRWVNVT